MARRKKRRDDEEASYWLSYSDMMAGLLLMFVMIISFTMLQSKRQYEADEKALQEQQTTVEAQQETLAAQQVTLDEQQTQLEEQKTKLEEQQTTVEEQQSTLVSQQETLDAQRTTLEEQQKTLTEQTKQLEDAQKALEEQQKQLEDAQSQLETAQTQLTAEQAKVTEQESALSEAEAQLSAQASTVAEAQTQLEEAQSKLEEQQTQIETQQQEMEDLIGVRAELVKALRDAFAGTAGVSVDSSGSIVFDSSILFDVGEYDLLADGEDFLNDFLPDYFNVLLSDNFVDYISEIIIEGHTDSDGDYIMNLELSQQRALAVASFILDDDGVLPSDTVEKLRKIVTANGRSYSNPIYTADGEEDKDASRRVEFKFRLKDEEMVQEMVDILNNRGE